MIELLRIEIFNTRPTSWSINSSTNHLIVFSRFYVGVHYISDLIIGAMLGYLIGLFVLWLDKKYKFGVI